jgi:hypothetical protein
MDACISDSDEARAQINAVGDNHEHYEQSKAAQDENSFKWFGICVSGVGPRRLAYCMRNFTHPWSPPVGVFWFTRELMLIGACVKIASS